MLPPEVSDEEEACCGVSSPTSQQEPCSGDGEADGEVGDAVEDGVAGAEEQPAGAHGVDPGTEGVAAFCDGSLRSPAHVDEGAGDGGACGLHGFPDLGDEVAVLFVSGFAGELLGCLGDLFHAEAICLHLGDVLLDGVPILAGCGASVVDGLGGHDVFLSVALVPQYCSTRG